MTQEELKLAIYVLLVVVIILFILLVGYGMSKKPMTDEEAEKYRQQLNDWQDRDNLEND